MHCLACGEEVRDGRCVACGLEASKEGQFQEGEMSGCCGGGCCESQEEVSCGCCGN